MKVLGISGSLRKASYNTRLLAAAGAMLGDDVRLEIHDLADVPFYDADLDGSDKPAGVRALLDAIGGADAVLFATPEFNYSIPGVLKNAIDWASRPAWAAASFSIPARVRSMRSTKLSPFGARSSGALNQWPAGEGFTFRKNSARLSPCQSPRCCSANSAMARGCRWASGWPAEKIEIGRAHV